jgi:hypothetical protein
VTGNKKPGVKAGLIELCDVRFNRSNDAIDLAREFTSRTLLPELT